MKKIANIMGMPVSIYLAEKSAKEKDIESIFKFFRDIDKKFSTYKTESEISKINKGELRVENSSLEMKKILGFSKKTKKETNGFFDIKNNGKMDPSGIVKGYAIWEAGKRLKKMGYKNFYVEIAGDIEVSGVNEKGQPWRVGIENPFDRSEIIKVLSLSDRGIATSGNYVRGVHIYNPKINKITDEVKSVTIVAKNVYEADRFATAVFAMGDKGIEFIEKTKGLEGYIVLKNKTAIYTTGFERYKAL